MDQRYQKIQEFEKKRSRTFWLALGAAVLHKTTTWLGGAAVTWATVVLMGGFASQLSISDFSTITLLVLLIISLLALALLTCKLVTKKSLSTGSLHPLQLTYCDPLLAIVNTIKFISILLQFSLLIWALCISRPAWQSLYSYAFSKHHVDNEGDIDSLQACLQSCATNHRLTDASAIQACSQFCFPAQNSTCAVTANLQVCLFTFHSLVIATCVAAILCNVYVFIRVAQAWWLMYEAVPKSLSLTRYHDEVLSRGLSIGLVEADEFDWRDFLVRSVGEDLVVRNIAPLEVKRQNEDFIEYLFYYPKGVEMVMGMLASENSLLQQTAANMPGFWSFGPKGMEKDGMELLSRLGEKLGMPGKVAEGAANSFKSLAIAWSREDYSPLLKVYVSRSGGSGGDSSHTPVRTSGEVVSGTLAPVRSGSVGGVESPEAVSRSGEGVEGGGEPVNAVPRSGGGDGASSSSISTESINVPSSSEVAGRGGIGTSESRPEEGEGHGRDGDTDSVFGGPGEGAGESMSILPEFGDTLSSSRGAGQGAAAADWSGGSGESSTEVPSASGGHGRVNGEARNGGGGNAQKWNVVQKVVDLVVNKRVPTLQVYVRALDSFFMSESVKESLTTAKREQIARKLMMIIQGNSNRPTANKDHKGVVVDSSAKARTRLLAFSALDRLRKPDLVSEGGKLLEGLDGHLNEVQEKFVIWIEEAMRYSKLCQRYSHKPGEWRSSGKWEVRGADFPPLP